MQPLIDADIFLYEVGSVGQYVDETTGDIVYRDFEWVAELLHSKVDEICKSVGATSEPRLFLTGNEKYWGDKYVPNFRESIAVSKKYKGTRRQDKPFHYYNLYHYIISSFDTTVSNGCEADDLIGIEQFSRRNDGETIICTRDKDIRMVPGAHYGWECGKQAEFGPHYYTDEGEIELVRKYDRHGKCTSSKIVGGGKAFFFAQLLTGDVVDNIGGLVRTGPIKAYDLLSECRTEDDYLSVVKQSYRTQVGEEGWLEALKEQADLLWISRERNEDGSLVGYEGFSSV